MAPKGDRETPVSAAHLVKSAPQAFAAAREGVMLFHMIWTPTRKSFPTSVHTWVPTDAMHATFT